MKQLIAFLLAALTAMTVTANDGTYYTSGNQLVPLQETQISIKKEILTISLRDNGYADIDVYYEFYNPGAVARDVRMGFEADPPYNDSYEFYPNGVHPYIENFTVEMNGQKIQHQNAVASDKEDKTCLLDLNEWTYDADEGMGMSLKNKKNGEVVDYSYVYYFDAHFKPGINVVHHTYSYSLSVIVGISWELQYKLSPAARWANKQIDDFTLIVKAENTAKHFVIQKNTFGFNNKFQRKSGNVKMRTLPNKYSTDMEQWEIAMRNASIEMHLNNFVPNAEKELNITSADSYYCFGAIDDKCHFGGFYDRSTASFVYMAETIDNGNIVPSDKAFRQRICRNLPFASRGHVFKDAKLKKFFESQFWYMPDPNYKDDTSDFTKADKQVMKHIIGKFDNND